MQIGGASAAALWLATSPWEPGGRHEKSGVRKREAGRARWREASLLQTFDVEAFDLFVCLCVSVCLCMCLQTQWRSNTAFKNTSELSPAQYGLRSVL